MLISKEYAELNKQLHATRPDYGNKADMWSDDIFTMATALKTESILDYGCGKAALAKTLPYQIQSYDPAITAYESRPRPADLVVCCDVLEHVEPEYLDNVLDDLHDLTKIVVYMTVATIPAKKSLADGRNAHLTVENYKWWLRKLWDRFEMTNYQNFDKKLFCFVGTPL